MKNHFISCVSLSALLACGLASTAFAAEGNLSDRVQVNSQLTFQYVTEDDKDLGTVSNGPDNSFSEQLQVSVKAPFTENLTGFINARALNINGDAGFDDDTGQSISAADSFVELRELWVRLDNIANQPPLSVQIGRQRLREPRSLWWNDDFDMVRADYSTTLLSGFVGLGENLASYRTSNSDDFRARDKDRLRFLGEGSWQYSYNQFLESRFVLENDHSGTEAVGSIVDANDRDNEDQNALWLGLRSTGTLQTAMADSAFKYRADVIGLVGNEDNLNTVAGPGANQRTVTGADHKDLRAWAFDGLASLNTGLPFHPVFTAGYAYGSGDGNAADGTDHTFRQNGLQGTSSRYGVERYAQKNYGEVLRPELSNLHILTLGVGVPVTEATDASLTYFNYHLADEATGMRGEAISAPLNGTSTHVGQEADFAVNVDVDSQLGIKPVFIKDIDLRMVAGTFFPGNAFKPGGTDTAYRIFSELKFRF